MLRKTLLTTFIFLLLSLFYSSLNAQLSKTLIGNLSDAKSTLTPAYVPADENYSISLFYQSYGLFQESPVNDRQLDLFTFSKSLKQGLGVNINIERQKNTFLSNTSFVLAGNYSVDFDPVKLTFGLDAGWYTIKSEDKFGRLRHEEDDAFVNQPVKRSLPDIGFGFYLQSNKIALGGSAKRFLSRYYGVLDYTSYYQFFVSYDTKLNKVFDFNSLGYIRSNERRETEIRIALTLWYKEMLAIGSQWESLGFVAINAKVNLYKLIPLFSERVQVSWYHAISYGDEQRASFGSKNELGINYNFNKRPSYKKILNEKTIDSPVQYN